MQNIELKAMQNIDGINERLRDMNVIFVVKIKYVNDLGKNIQKCIDGMNLYLLNKNMLIS
jgi:hypothetical protein